MMLFISSVVVGIMQRIYLTAWVFFALKLMLFMISRCLCFFFYHVKQLHSLRSHRCLHQSFTLLSLLCIKFTLLPYFLMLSFSLSTLMLSRLTSLSVEFVGFILDRPYGLTQVSYHPLIPLYPLFLFMCKQRWVLVVQLHDATFSLLHLVYFLLGDDSACCVVREILQE